MIKLLLHKTKDYSMTNGVVFTDKSYNVVLLMDCSINNGWKKSLSIWKDIERIRLNKEEHTALIHCIFR